MIKILDFGEKIPSIEVLSTMPIKPEILALKMPAGIFPLAIEIITTEEETVEGKQARKKMQSTIAIVFHY